MENLKYLWSLIDSGDLFLLVITIVILIAGCAAFKAFKETNSFSIGLLSFVLMTMTGVLGSTLLIEGYNIYQDYGKEYTLVYKVHYHNSSTTHVVKSKRQILINHYGYGHTVHIEVKDGPSKVVDGQVEVVSYTYKMIRQ